MLPVLNGIMKFRSEITTEEDDCQSPLVLIIAPTRELVDQICKSAEGLCEGTGFRPTVIYGGVRVSYQRDRVKEGCSVLIATPGRLLHFLNESLVNSLRSYIEINFTNCVPYFWKIASVSDIYITHLKTLSY